ncbi:MAG TPA: DNA methyltransferase, partial [Negativicutes bacterium]|nr:DNA methyltransferase [Negativicutes bacterium]
YISSDGTKILGTGDTLPLEKTIDEYDELKVGSIALWPIRQDGTDGRWQLSQDSFRQKQERGLIKLGPYKGQNTTVYYLKPAEEAKLNDGTYTIQGYNEDGSVITSTANSTERKAFPTTQWRISSHDSTHYGTRLIKKFIPGREFAFPKSLYAVHDTVMFFVANKPNALIVDFFAGSGTTLHAVNLLNAEDGGHRRCIMVTNNEVSDDESKALTKAGYRPGDPEWEKLGIARYVTWPRTVCAIEGHDVNGNPLKGNYIGSDIPMSDGFKANAAFFKLGFLDKTSVALGKQFKEMLPTLWLKAGAQGKCPSMEGNVLDMLILPENHFAVLINENVFSDFKDEVAKHPEIQTAYLITDYEVNYRAMKSSLAVETTYQLYRDYLDNFRINHGRA